MSLMIKRLPESYIINVINKLAKTSDGFTFPVSDLKTGYFVAVSGELTTVESVVKAWRKSDDSDFIGCYTHPDGRKVFELSIHTNHLSKAVELGVCNNQYSIWDIKNNKEIILNS